MLSTFTILEVLAILFGPYRGASLHYADHPLLYKIDTEDPYVFYKNNRIVHANYVKGNKDGEFYADNKEYNMHSKISLNSHFKIDSTRFDFKIKSAIHIPKTTYKDGNTILAISGNEGGDKIFRDFLINNSTNDANLKWNFRQKL